MDYAVVPIGVGGATEKDVLEDSLTRTRYIAKLGGRNSDLEVMTEYIIYLIGQSLGMRDLRRLPLEGRKRELRRLVPRTDSRLMYVEPFAGHGRALYREICRRDLEGIVAKHRHAPYFQDATRTTWLKVKNMAYTQARTGTNSLPAVPRADAACSRSRSRSRALIFPCERGLILSYFFTRFELHSCMELPPRGLLVAGVFRR